MRRVWVILATIGMTAGLALAQTAGQPQQDQAKGKHAHGQKSAVAAGAPDAERGHGRMAPEQIMDKLTKELSLTQDQQDKVRKLLNDHREKMKQTFQQGGGDREKFQDLRTQYQAAKAANDKEKMKAVEDQMRQLRASSGMDQSRQELVKGIEAVLTPEQATKFNAIKGELFGGPGGPSGDLQTNPRLLFAAVKSLNLPAEQMQRIEPIFKDARAKMDANQDPQARKAAAADIYNQVMGQLTPEQQAKVKEFKAPAGHAPDAANAQGDQGKHRREGGKRHQQGADQQSK
jgi:Spy/CpxP family protein refolding chaperone